MNTETIDLSNLFESLNFLHKALGLILIELIKTNLSGNSPGHIPKASYIRDALN